MMAGRRARWSDSSEGNFSKKRQHEAATPLPRTALRKQDNTIHYGTAIGFTKD